ncbi:hypothetical protein COU80_00420 [Candidatus Peregrinibacteria bacterium CG10_big_fil_rev_8_21_14_0_10_55_24]|nr:MAG: hypothetical protein COU80_00420 [Candidatus Peregrinibacteria bacterium CG10_big_fil_rev_8_21_14_0_10_55_24]
MREDGEHLVWAVKTVVKKPPTVWEDHLKTIGMEGAKVLPVPEDANGATEVVEVVIDSAGVRMSRERIKGIETTLRSAMGQVLEN